MEDILEKNCKRCGKLKPLEKYPKCANARDGRTGRCYGCASKARYYLNLDGSRAKGRQKTNHHRTVNRDVYLASKVSESAKYHAACRSLTNTLTAHEWRMIKAFYREACAYCGQENTPLFRVRIIPVSQGGELSARNVAPACPRCSAGKRDRCIRPLLMHNVREEKAHAGVHRKPTKTRVLPENFHGTGNVPPHLLASYY